MGNVGLANHGCRNGRLCETAGCKHKSSDHFGNARDRLMRPCSVPGCPCRNYLSPVARCSRCNEPLPSRQIAKGVCAACTQADLLAVVASMERR